VIITEGGHPYVIGTRLKLEGDEISEVEALVPRRTAGSSGRRRVMPARGR
jgi:hypothetical protein